MPPSLAPLVLSHSGKPAAEGFLQIVVQHLRAALLRNGSLSFCSGQLLIGKELKI